MPEDKDYWYWVTTESDEQFGPYDTWEAAHFFASINLEPGTWTITTA